MAFCSFSSCFPSIHPLAILSKTPSLNTGGQGLIILFAGAKNSSVLYTIFEPKLDWARSINPFK